MEGLDSRGILEAYRARWTIENGIKDLVENYYFNNIPGIDPHRINLYRFVVTLARFLFEMLCKDYEQARNADNTKKTIDTLRPEFITGTKATLPREKDELILTWNDHYDENQHQALTALSTKLNEEMGEDGLPFLGGLRLRFEIAPPRPNQLRNQFRRGLLEF